MEQKTWDSLQKKRRNTASFCLNHPIPPSRHCSVPRGNFPVRHTFARKESVGEWAASPNFQSTTQTSHFFTPSRPAKWRCWETARNKEKQELSIAPMHGSHCGSQQSALQTSLTALTTEEGTNGRMTSIAATYFPTVDFTSFCPTSIHAPMGTSHSLHPAPRGAQEQHWQPAQASLSIWVHSARPQPCGWSSPPCTPRANTSSCATACCKPTTHHKPPLQCACLGGNWGKHANSHSCLGAWNKPCLLYHLPALSCLPPAGPSCPMSACC